MIVGAGPAGLAAAVYGASEGLHTMVVTAGPGRSGRDVLADRELPRLSLRRVGDGGEPSAAAGTPARRGDPRHARDRAHRPRDAPGPSRRRRRHPGTHDHPRVRRRVAEARDRRLRPPGREGDLLRRGAQRGAHHARPGHSHRGRGQLGGPGRALLLQPCPQRHHVVSWVDGREQHVALPHRPARGAREHPHPARQRGDRGVRGRVARGGRGAEPDQQRDHSTLLRRPLHLHRRRRPDRLATARDRAGRAGLRTHRP